MSGVYERNRSVSAFDFYTDSLDIRVEVNRIAAKGIDKTYRFILGVPMAQTAYSLVHNINRADSFYPNTTINVQERRKYLTLAVADCEQLCLDLQCAIDMGQPVKVSRLESLIERIETTIGNIKGARKKVKLITKEPLESRIEATAAELQRLQDMEREVQ